MSTEFKRGDKVTVSFEGTVTATSDTSPASCLNFVPNGLGYSYGSGFIQIDDKHGTSHVIWVGPDPDQNVVSKATPEDWPAQLGDIWEVNGVEYFCYRGSLFSHKLILYPVDNDGSGHGYPENEFNDFLAQGPTLVRRRDA